MAEVTLVFWRDIPAQVIAGRGRGAVKLPLPERFEQAIDRCAMKIGARDADAYMAEWRKAAPVTHAEPDAEAAEATRARILSEYDSARLAALIANDGWDSPRP
ncbi:virulence factor [Phaeovulum sp.]|uniref:virulence factor n=1 Tax=Phaeovulum sp. TaxID=2934796 RepID=UPI003563C441